MKTVKRRNGGFLPELRNNLSEYFDIERFMEEPFSAWHLGMNDGRFTRIPAANIRETVDEYVVELAAPGLNKKDFQVSTDDKVLEIKVEKSEESSEKLKSFTRREYDYSAFRRTFYLPETVQPGKIKAEYADGSLYVHLPKVASAKKLPVKEIAVG